jgi:hypothetical protein
MSIVLLYYGHDTLPLHELTIAQFIIPIIEVKVPKTPIEIKLREESTKNFSYHILHIDIFAGDAEVVAV